MWSRCWLVPPLSWERGKSGIKNHLSRLVSYEGLRGWPQTQELPTRALGNCLLLLELQNPGMKQQHTLQANPSLPPFPPELEERASGSS